MYTFEVRFGQGRTARTTLHARNEHSARQVLYRRFFAIASVKLIAAVNA